MAARSPDSAATYFQIMRALLAKDLRLARGLVMWLISIGSVIYGLVVVYWLNVDHSTNTPDESLLFYLCLAGVYALSGTAFLAAGFGGSAIAKERADRTAEFLALLPVTRWHVIASKWTVSAAALAAAAAFHLTVLFSAGFVVSHKAGHQISFNPDALWVGPTWLAAVVCLFGVGWACSSFMRIAAAAGGIALVITMASLFWWTFPLLLGRPDRGMSPTELMQLDTCILAAVGVPGLVAGTAIYVRRVSP